MQHLGFTRLGTAQGYPLAIIHGWGCDGSFLLPLAKMFPERDIYLIDLPGYGRSEDLAPIASDFSATIYYLINTIPHGADVISWSFGTLYALRAMTSINDPSINLESLAHTVMANPKIKDLAKQAKCNCLPKELIPEGASIAHYRIEEKAAGLSSQLNKGCAPLEAERAAPDDPMERQSLLACRLCSNYETPFIRSLITICGSPRFPSDPNWQGLSPEKILKCNTELTPKRLKRLVHLFYRMMIDARTASPQESQYIHELITNTPDINPEVLMAGIRHVTYIDERPALKHLNRPSLHLFGAQDRLVPCEQAQQFVNDPLHRAYVFAHSGHNPYLSEPELFEQVVRAFFAHVQNGTPLCLPKDTPLA